MKRNAWIRGLHGVALLLWALSFLLPLYRIESVGGVDQVYAASAVREDWLLLVWFLAPAFVVIALRAKPPKWLAIVDLFVAPIMLVCVSLIILSVASMGGVGSPFWRPQHSVLGLGCWGFLLANAVLLVAWGAAVFGALRSGLRERNPTSANA